MFGGMDTALVFGSNLDNYVPARYGDVRILRAGRVGVP